jgi:hypothetical protein
MRRLLGLLGGGAIFALAIGQYSLSRHLEKIEATLERLADANDVSNREEGQPRLAYQLRSGGGVTKDELRAILREEFQASRSAAPPAVAAEEGPAKPAPATAPPESIAAYQSAQRVVQNAVSARVWGEKEAAEMRSLIPQLTPEQLQAIHSTLLPAVNSQQVRVQIQGPLF